jgi:hypothetical protein
LVFGHMPVLGWAAERAGYAPLSAYPSPGYARSEDLGTIALLIGDFIPLPNFLKILSIGDLSLFAGCVLLLGCILLRLLGPPFGEAERISDRAWRGGESMQSTTVKARLFLDASAVATTAAAVYAFAAPYHVSN